MAGSLGGGRSLPENGTSVLCAEKLIFLPPFVQCVSCHGELSFQKVSQRLRDVFCLQCLAMSHNNLSSLLAPTSWGRRGHGAPVVSILMEDLRPRLSLLDVALSPAS